MQTRLNVLLSASAGALVLAATQAYAADSCSAYPTGTAEQIDYTELDAKLGPIPAPSKPLLGPYVPTVHQAMFPQPPAGLQRLLERRRFSLSKK